MTETPKLDQISQNQPAILLGETGAMIHMFDKASEVFLERQSSKEGDKEILPKPKVPLGFNPENFKFTIEKPGTSEQLTAQFSDFITTQNGSNSKDYLLKLFNRCHGATSADEKGVVRRKQSSDSTCMITPFGSGSVKLNFDQIDQNRQSVNAQLASLFTRYTDCSLTEAELRNQLIATVKPLYQSTLGETRQPANDVTLWDQTYGVACAYKSALAELAVTQSKHSKNNTQEEISKNLKWRLFGIAWNGQRFFESAKKPGDVRWRQQVLKKLKCQIQNLLEITYPIGNLFYADTNGMFFTFPGLNTDLSKQLVAELWPKIYAIFESHDLHQDLFPFLTLSSAERHFTNLPKEIEKRAQKLGVDHISPGLLLLENSSDTWLNSSIPAVCASCATRENSPDTWLNSPDATLPNPNPEKWNEMCVVCQFRPAIKRNVADIPKCNTCINRSKNQQNDWYNNPNGTIWIDEVADQNNRIALVTLRFDISRWLDGSWFKTIFCQTLDEWKRNVNCKEKKFCQTLNDCTQNNPNDKCKIIIREIDRIKNFNILAKCLGSVDPNTCITKAICDGLGGNAKNTIENIENRLGLRSITSQQLLTFLFTQNPSPGRLARVWQTTEKFFDDVSEFLNCAGNRIKFSVTGEMAVQVGNTLDMYFDSSKGPITIKTVCVDQSNNQITFKTIESIEQHLNKPDFLLQTILKWKLEDALIWNECKIAVSEPNQEAYEKKISLVKDPTFFQMLLPASGVKEFLSKLIEKYDTEFFYVKGKLPLHVNVTVANRNMPLYVLMESGRAAVAHPTEDRKSYEAMPICQSDTNTLDDFFGYGTTKAPWDSDFNVGHLTHGYPDQSGMVRQWGRFTTNFLKSSADRYKFPSISFTFDQLAAYKKCWEILSGLSSTQQQRLVGLLIEKDHWPNEEKAAKDAYQQMVMGYVGANLSPNVRDQFLKIGPQQILDTFNFYRLILKETSNDSRPTD